MAVAGLEVELITGGTEERPAQRGAWVQNMWKPLGKPEWETRPGFGQVAQIDTSLSVAPEFAMPDSGWGYTKFLGCSPFTTSWGSEQIVSVFLAQALTGHADANASSLWSPLYLVSVFDLSTNQKWEEVIFRHTSENKEGPVLMPKWQGHFESYQGVDHQKLVAGLQDSFYFHTFNQSLFFGNKYTGTLVYRPSDYRKARHQTVPSLYEAGYVKGYSESSRVSRVVPVDGLSPESFNYLNETEMPEIVDICSLQNRLVVASKSNIYFSDPGVPNAFVDQNVVEVPSEQDVVALSSINNNLMVFTKSETYMYQPSAGDNLGLGRFTLATGSVGCLGRTATLTDGEVLYWVDRNGVHATSNGLSVQTLSDPIQPFFSPTATDSGITSPLNHYLTASGVADPSTKAQPRTLYRLDENEIISMAIWPEYGALFFASPSNNIAWCLTQNQWSMWNFESSVSTTAAPAPQVGVQQNIIEPYIVNANDKIHLVTGIETQSFTGTAPSPQTVKSNSYSILECGRGGGLDRSVENEDYRYVRAGYDLAYFAAGSPQGRLFIEEPTYDAATGEYWTLVSMVPGIAASPRPTGVTFRFTYDSTNWTLKPAVTLPNERLASAAGYALTFPAAQTAQIAFASVTPLEMADGQKNPFFILRWTPVSAATTKLRLKIAGVAATSTDGTSTINMTVYSWRFHSGPLNANDSVAQPVDWVYKSAQVGIENNNQVKSRGLFTRFVSHGRASSQLNTGWVWGLFNTLAAPDWKGWSSQIMDFSGAPKSLASIANKTTVRTRFKDTLGQLNQRSFNYPSAAPPTPPKYGTPGAPSDGDYLIDDSEYDTISTSDSTRGEYLTYMMFGFIRNKAEKLVVASSKVLLRGNQGGPRRKGR
jgi:hypothetical protein